MTKIFCINFKRFLPYMGHLGHVTRTIWTNFRSRVLRSLHMKFEFNWPSGFRGEDVWKSWRMDWRQTDVRRSHWYTISSPMSLRLRWANNSCNGCIPSLLLTKHETIFCPLYSTSFVLYCTFHYRCLSLNHRRILRYDTELLDSRNWKYTRSDTLHTLSPIFLCRLRG